VSISVGMKAGFEGPICGLRSTETNSRLFWRGRARSCRGCQGWTWRLVNTRSGARKQGMARLDAAAARASAVSEERLPGSRGRLVFCVFPVSWPHLMRLVTERGPRGVSVSSLFQPRGGGVERARPILLRELQDKSLNWQRPCIRIEWPENPRGPKILLVRQHVVATAARCDRHVCCDRKAPALFDRQSRPRVSAGSSIHPRRTASFRPHAGERA
jgi:hypothetical protein